MIYPLVARAIFAGETQLVHSSETTSVALLPTRDIVYKPSKEGSTLMQPMAASYERAAISASEQEMLEYIKQKESGGSPEAQNPRSSAYGLYGFLDSTWPSVGCIKTSDPIEQERCAILYMKQRYGSIEGAYLFHLKAGWY